jgi:putative ATP-dependent endonuclease of the OLD family
MNTTSPLPAAPSIRLLRISRFRGIESLIWRPDHGLNVILGGGDVCKTTILEAIAMLLSPHNATALSDADYWRREVEKGFEIEAVMVLPAASGINRQSKQMWPWAWDGQDAQLPTIDGASKVDAPVYRLRVRGSPDFELTHEAFQPDGDTEHLPVSVRRAIGLVRLGGDDRNDRDLRLVQGSSLDRLLFDRSLRARLGQRLAASDVEDQLNEDGKGKLSQLDAAFQKRALPASLGLGLTGGQGFSIGALIGLTADKDEVQLPLASWGAGTRRLASLEIAAACQGDCPITLVDEVERGLEPYRQRVLIGRLQTGPSQVFLTTHSAAAISSATEASLWYMDAAGSIGRLPRQRIARQQARDPETFLARLTVVAEGAAEVGFSRSLLERAIPGSLHDRGIWITEGHGNSSSLDLLEALAEGGLMFGGFVDNEGTSPTRWAALRAKLGPLLFQWRTSCLEENVIKLVPSDQLEFFIQDPDGERTGDPFRTLAERLGLAQKDFASIKAKAPDLAALIIGAATGSIPDNMGNVRNSEKKALRNHGTHWFKSVDGGRELAQKVFAFGIWPQLKGQLLPFLNAVRKLENLLELTDLS